MSLFYAQQFATTKLSVTGGITDSQTTGIVLQSVTGIDIAKAGVLCLSWSDPLDTNAYEYVSYTSIDGSNELQGVTRGVEGSTGRAHANLVDVAWVLTESHINNLNAAMVAEHSEAGAHKSFTIAGTSSAPSYIGLAEDTDNGTNYIRLQAPAALTASTTLTLPDGAGTAGDVLSTNGTDTLSWTAQSGVPKKARVYKDSHQSINNNTPTAVTFNQEVLDNDTMHDNSTNNERLTIKTAGLYLFKAQVSFANNATGVRRVYIYKNGVATNIHWCGEGANGSDRTTVQVSGIADAAVNDYFTVIADQGSGGALNIEGAASDAYYASNFECVRLGASS